MAYGLEITAKSGKIFASPDTPFMHFHGKGTFSNTGVHHGNLAHDYNTGISSSIRLVTYVRCSVLGFIYTIPYVKNGTWWFTIHANGNFSATFYYFTNQIPKGRGGWGLEIYNASGTRIYSSSTMPLANRTGSLPDRNAAPIVPGFSPAVIASPCTYWAQPVQQQNVQFMVGAPCAYSDRIALTVIGTGVMPSSEGFSFNAFGGLINYINASLYD